MQRQRLASMKMSALRRKALADGTVTPELLLSIDDEGGDPKTALIALMLQRPAAGSSLRPSELESEETKKSSEAAARAELAQLKTSELRARAAACASISTDEIDEADDSGDARAALMTLLVAKAALSASACPGPLDTLVRLFADAEASEAACTRLVDTLEIGAELLVGELVT
eukprot:SAG22_NODE_3732_length_1554_cov_4.066667_1_plen_171_part_01